MVTFYIVLRNETVVLDSGFVQKVCCVGFLEQGIADVFLVSQDLVDGASFIDGFVRVASTKEKTIGIAIDTVGGLVFGMK